MANNKKQFGVWLDGQDAYIIGRENINDGPFINLAHVGGEKAPFNSNENTLNNHRQTLEQKYFKNVASHMQNADEVHVTGTGQIQEKFIKYLASTQQFKNTKATECTSNKMSEERLVEFFTEKFGN